MSPIKWNHGFEKRKYLDVRLKCSHPSLTSRLYNIRSTEVRGRNKRLPKLAHFSLLPLGRLVASGIMPRLREACLPTQLPEVRRLTASSSFIFLTFTRYLILSPPKRTQH